MESWCRRKNVTKRRGEGRGAKGKMRLRFSRPHLPDFFNPPPLTSGASVLETPVNTF